MKKQRQTVRLFTIFCLMLALVAGITAESAPADAAKKKTKLSIKLNVGKLSLKMGSRYTLKAKVKPAKAKAKVKWKSSKKKVAAVSSKGKITPKKTGETTITATLRYKKVTKKASCKVKVIDKKSVTPAPSPMNTATSAPQQKRVSQIVTEKSSYTLEIGKTLALNASVLPADASSKALTYTSDNPSVASVDEKGTVQPFKEGTANITIRATDGSQVVAVVQIKVVSMLTSIEQETITLNVGDTYVLAPQFVPESATLYSCSISNTKDYVASVSEDGSVAAKYPGITMVTISSASNPEVNCQFRIQVTDDFSAPEGFDKKDDSIAHGQLKNIRYPSAYRSTARARIWLPPNYEEEKEHKQYNLLFCLHGGADNETYWTSNGSGENDGCSADRVLDNAYAKGLMEDTIVVFTSGVIPYDSSKEYPDIVPNPLLTDFWKNYYLLEFEIINDLLPYMEENYSVMTGPEHTGICGLSMGCGQTMEIAFKNPDLFGYVGCYSAGPYEKDDQVFVKSKEDAEYLNSKFKLLFFITGEEDHMMDDSMRNFVKTCDSFDLNHLFYEVPGRGHVDSCWDRCLYVFMKYAFK